MSKIPKYESQQPTGYKNLLLCKLKKILCFLAPTYQSFGVSYFIAFNTGAAEMTDSYNILSE